MQYQSLEVFNEHVDNLVDVVKRAPDIVDLQPIFFRYTLDITTALIFNQSTSTLRNEGRDLFSEGFGYAANVTAMRARLGDFYWLHTPRRFVRACKDVKMYADGFIAQALSNAKADPVKPASNKQQNPTFITDLFDELKDPEKVRDQLINVLLAGRDTTACLMTWAVRLLVRHPRALKRLQAEIFDVAGNQVYMSRADIKKMTFLQHVLNETLRLYPPVPINLRFANKATIMPRGGGPDGNAPVLIRKGMSMSYSPYHMHRRRDFWGNDALEFNPDRWADRALTESKWIKWAYLPFNGGPRVCLGMDMALMEASYGLARIVQAFPNLALPPDTTIEPPGTERQALTLVLASGDGCKVVK
jgi:cytochrome P450